MKEETIKENTKIAEEILLKIIENTKEGVSTYDLNRVAEKEFKRYEAMPSTFVFGYENYISVAKNEEVLFGKISKEEILRQGDLVKIALGLFRNNYFTDLGFSLLLGNENEYPKKQTLISGTAHALCKAIERIKEGTVIDVVSGTIEDTLSKYDLAPVYEIMGHGVGRNLHEKPNIPNKRELPLVDYSYELKRGEIVCIEPIATLKNGKIIEESETILTRNRKPVAHFELPVLIKKDEGEVLAERLYSCIRELF